jgi:hypothetical protein
MQTKEGKEFLNCTIATDETCVCNLEPEYKSQSAQKNHQSSPYLSQCGHQQSKVKKVISMAYNCVSTTAIDHVAVGLTVTKNSYANLFQQKLVRTDFTCSFTHSFIYLAFVRSWCVKTP